MLILLCVLVIVKSITIPTEVNIDALELLEAEEISEQQLKKIQGTQQVFLLDIADYLEGTTIYNFLGTLILYEDLQNKDNQSKRIVIATILSIILIVVCCVMIQFVLDVSKKCKIKLSRENTPIVA